MTSCEPPVGPPVSSPHGAPDGRVLEGARVRLERLDPDRHADDLDAALRRGADPHLWRYLPYGPFEDAAELRAWLAAHAAGDDPLAYAIVVRSGARAVGTAALMRIRPGDGVAEIGHVALGSELQRTAAATEALALLARHVLDDLGWRRLEWKCDALNARSRRAAERLGFTYEGTFRQDRVVRGRNRDTAWFSIVDHEWPRLRAALDAWLDPANHDGRGRQRRTLEAVRDATA